MCFPQDCSGKQNQVHDAGSRLWAASWSGASFIGLTLRRRRICRWFCVCSVLGGQFRARLHILEPGRGNKLKSCSEQDRVSKWREGKAHRGREPPRRCLLEFSSKIIKHRRCIYERMLSALLYAGKQCRKHLAMKTHQKPYRHIMLGCRL